MPWCLKTSGRLGSALGRTRFHALSGTCIRANRRGISDSHTLPVPRSSPPPCGTGDSTVLVSGQWMSTRYIAFHIRRHGIQEKAVSIGSATSLIASKEYPQRYWHPADFFATGHTVAHNGCASRWQSHCQGIPLRPVLPQPEPWYGRPFRTSRRSISNNLANLRLLRRHTESKPTDAAGLPGKRSSHTEPLHPKRLRPPHRREPQHRSPAA